MKSKTPGRGKGARPSPVQLDSTGEGIMPRFTKSRDGGERCTLRVELRFTREEYALLKAYLDSSKHESMSEVLWMESSLAMGSFIHDLRVGAERTREERDAERRKGEADFGECAACGEPSREDGTCTRPGCVDSD